MANPQAAPGPPPAPHAPPTPSTLEITSICLNSNFQKFNGKYFHSGKHIIMLKMEVANVYSITQGTKVSPDPTIAPATGSGSLVLETLELCC